MIFRFLASLAVAVLAYLVGIVWLESETAWLACLVLGAVGGLCCID